jgi:hypothetical protein
MDYEKSNGGLRNEEQHRIAQRAGQLCRSVHGCGSRIRIGANRFRLEQRQHRVSKLDSFMARDARLLGTVGVNINPEYRVLAEAERASAEGFLKGIATVIQIEAIQDITGCEIEISESGDEN